MSKIAVVTDFQSVRVGGWKPVHVPYSAAAITALLKWA